MDLYIDVGNTATKIGTYCNNKMVLRCVKRTESYLNDDNSLDFNLSKDDMSSITRVAISSVVPSASKKLFNYFSFLKKEIYFISPTDDSGVKIEIDDVNELGTDLLCDLAAGYKIYKSPLLIIDLGTVTKFLFIDKNGVFSTCSFIPGLELTLKTLSKNTALLPKIEVGSINPLLDNHNTKDVIMASTYYSHIDTLNGMVKRYQKEVGYMFKVVITGGNLNLIKNDKELEFPFEIIEELCLQGIKIIMDRK